MRFNLDSESQPVETKEAKSIPQGVGSPEAVAKFEESTNYVNVIQEKKRQMIEQFRTEFATIGAAFFEAVPRLKSLTWTQYTPYFMDGDPCEFSVNTVSFATDENEELENYREFEEADGSFSGEAYTLKSLVTSEEYKLCEKMEKIIYGNSGLMQDLFGDHALVVLRASGVIVEEYEDHD